MSSLAELVALLNRRRRENQENSYQGEYFDPQAYNDNQALLAETRTPVQTVFEQEAEDLLKRQNRNSTPVEPVYPASTDFGHGEQGKTLFDRDSEDLLRRRNMYDTSGGVKEPGVFGGGQAGADAYVGGKVMDKSSDDRHQIYYSRDDQRMYLVDSATGKAIGTWECRSKFVPGVNEQGEPRESLPIGTYRVSAELTNGKYGAPYGTFYITTGDPRGRDIHGGGSGLPDPFAPEQDWVDTYGCLRMQNRNGEELSRHIINHGNSMLLHVIQKPLRFGE